MGRLRESTGASQASLVLYLALTVPYNCLVPQQVTCARPEGCLAGAFPGGPIAQTEPVAERVRVRESMMTKAGAWCRSCARTAGRWLGEAR